MSDYVRTTRECAVADLKPELLQAIHGYAQAHELGSVDVGSRLRCETKSEKKKKASEKGWHILALRLAGHHTRSPRGDVSAVAACVERTARGT